MKFKKYMKESTDQETKPNLVEFLDNPDKPLIGVEDEIDSLYAPVKKLIDAKKFSEAAEELSNLEKDLDEFELENSKKKFFRFPQFMIDGQRKQIETLRAHLPIEESIDDMDKRCEKCNTLLNDGGTCPKCDDGEEDYGDELHEELSNKEKLLRAFPELNFDNEPLTEGTGAEATKLIRDAMSSLSQDNKNTWAKKVKEIVEVIPDTYADELFDSVKKSFSNVNVSSADKRKIADATDELVPEENILSSNKLGDILNAIDITQWSKKNPKLIKTFVLIVLGIIAAIEPTPVVELIVGIVSLLPDNVVAKIASVLSVATNPVAAGIAATNKARQTNEELSVRERLKAAYPELNFNESKRLEEDSEDFEYDDDYYDLDDVEQDRAHSALYGGDRDYCDCGHRLIMTEYGSYCPKCNPKDPEDIYD